MGSGMADSSVLVSLLSGRPRGGDADENAEPREILAAVLLRRDIAALAGGAVSATTSAAVALMRKIAEPLVASFAGGRGGIADLGRALRREAVRKFAPVSEECGREWMASLLGRLEHSVSRRLRTW